jgi:hypothetical protein
MNHAAAYGLWPLVVINGVASAMGSEQYGSSVSSDYAWPIGGELCTQDAGGCA